MLDYPRYVGALLLLPIAISAQVEYCEGESFRMQCGLDEVILMESALYGRMELGRCISRPHDVMNCSLKVLPILDSLCSGRRECDVTVTYLFESIPKHQRPCSDELRNYLVAEATCVKVITPLYDCNSNPPETLRSPFGLIASLTTAMTECGSFAQPWKIEVSAGQRIKLTLLDFMAYTKNSGSILNDITNVCEVYATVAEGQSRTETICRRDLKLEEVYISNTNSISIRLVTPKDSEKYFIIQYQAIGCSTLPAPEHGWVKQTATHASLGCNYTSAKWQLVCENDVWVGENKTCPPPSVLSDASLIASSNGLLGTQSEWLVITVIVAIAVFLGTVIFVSGLLYLRRKGNRPNASHVTTLYAPEQSPYYPSGMGTYPVLIPDYTSRNSRPKPNASNSLEANLPPNDYSRTWQMQKHQQLEAVVTSQFNSKVRLPENTLHSTECGRFDILKKHDTEIQRSEIDGRPIPEHIYESPSFVRKVQTLEGNNRQDEGRLVSQGRNDSMKQMTYFELDPSSRKKV